MHRLRMTPQLNETYYLSKFQIENYPELKPKVKTLHTEVCKFLDLYPKDEFYRIGCHADPPECLKGRPWFQSIVFESDGPGIFLQVELKRADEYLLEIRKQHRLGKLELMAVLIRGTYMKESILFLTHGVNTQRYWISKNAGLSAVAVY